MLRSDTGLKINGNYVPSVQEAVVAAHAVAAGEWRKASTHLHILLRPQSENRQGKVQLLGRH